MILASHDLADVNRVADTIVPLDDGVTAEPLALESSSLVSVEALEAELFGR